MDPQPKAGRYLKKARVRAGKKQTEVGEYLYEHGFARAYRTWTRDQLANLVDDIEDGRPWPKGLSFAHFAWLCFNCIGAQKGGQELTNLALLGGAWALECESRGLSEMVQSAITDSESEPEPPKADEQPS